MATEEINNAVAAVVPPVTETPAAAETPVVDAAAAAKETPTPAAEVKYDLKLSEGSPLTQAHIDEIASFAKERGLSNEAAQEILAREEGVIKNIETIQHQQNEAQRTAWYEEMKNDKVLGGDNLKQTAEIAQRGLQAFAEPSIIEFLKTSPLGNNPDLIRTFYKIGKAIQNDTLVTANSHSAKQKSYEEKLYDNTPKET